MSSDTPVFCKAVDMGNMAPNRIMLSQLMVFNAASTLRKHPVKIMATAASITAVTGAMGMKSNAMAATIANIITAAMGAL